MGLLRAISTSKTTTIGDEVTTEKQARKVHIRDVAFKLITVRVESGEVDCENQAVLQFATKMAINQAKIVHDTDKKLLN